MYNKQSVSTMIQAATTKEGRDMLNEIVDNLSPKQLDLMSELRGIPTDLKPMYESIIKGDLSPLDNLVKNLSDWFKTGDIILMAGNSIASKIILKAQKRIYKEARSSHVAIVSADFMAFDAIPQIGVSPRLISEILSNCIDNWRIIRLKGLEESKHEIIQQACTYYFMQSYLISPSKKALKKHSYCSELVRKVYEKSNIKNTGIPKSSLIKPCDFDKLADYNNNWIDVTAKLKPAVEVCTSVAPILNAFHEHYTNGLRLNRERFEDRKKTRINIRKYQKQNEISKELADDMIAKIDETDLAMKNQFWDISKM